MKEFIFIRQAYILDSIFDEHSNDRSHIARFSQHISLRLVDRCHEISRRVACLDQSRLIVHVDAFLCAGEISHYIVDGVDSRK